MEKHLPLAQIAVKRAVPNALRSHADDAYAEACCGLIEAAGRVRPERMEQFPAYAMVIMRHRITDYLVRATNPVGDRRFGQRIARIRRELGGQPIAEVDDKTLAKSIGLPPVAVRRLRVWVDRDPAGPEEVGREEDISAEIAAREDAAQIHERLGLLSWTDRFVVNRLFGLDGQDPLTVMDLAGVMGCSCQRIRFRLNRALRRMRAAWRT